jgi:hypothetical protein
MGGCSFIHLVYEPLQAAPIASLTQTRVASTRRWFEASWVEVMGRYSNLCDQGECLRGLLEMVPGGLPGTFLRTLTQRQRRLRSPEIDDLVTRLPSGFNGLRVS